MRASRTVNNLSLAAIVLFACILLTPARTVDPVGPLSRGPLSAQATPPVPEAIPAVTQVGGPASWIERAWLPSVDRRTMSVLGEERWLIAADGPTLRPAPEPTNTRPPDHQSSGDATWLANRDVALIGQQVDMEQFAPRRSGWAPASGTTAAARGSRIGRGLMNFTMAAPFPGGDRL
jgi:hypothetical protein